MSGPELHLKLAHAKAGVAPARALLDAGGRIVVAQDIELSDTTLDALDRRDVTEPWALDSRPQAIDINGQEAALQHHHRERLARLFRHVGESADGHYLLDAIARHRGVDPS